MLNEQIKFMLDTKFENIWNFVEMFYPNYHNCDQIAHNDDLRKIVDGEYEEGDDAHKYFEDVLGSSLTEAENELAKSNAEIYHNAIVGFLTILNQERTVQIIMSDDDREEYKVYYTDVDNNIFGEFLCVGSFEDCLEYCDISKLKITNIDEHKDYFRKKHIEQLREPIFNLLSYLFEDIGWDYSKLTDKEKEVISEKDFNTIKNIK